MDKKEKETFGFDELENISDDDELSQLIDHGLSPSSSDDDSDEDMGSSDPTGQAQIVTMNDVQIIDLDSDWSSSLSSSSGGSTSDTDIDTDIDLFLDNIPTAPPSPGQSTLVTYTPAVEYEPIDSKFVKGSEFEGLEYFLAKMRAQQLAEENRKHAESLKEAVEFAKQGLASGTSVDSEKPCCSKDVNKYLSGKGKEVTMSEGSDTEGEDMSISYVVGTSVENHLDTNNDDDRSKTSRPPTGNLQQPSSSSSGSWSGNTAALTSNGVSITLVASPNSTTSPLPSSSSSSSSSGSSTASATVSSSNGISIKREIPSCDSPAPPVLEDYSAKCDSCGRLGVKRTFSSKSRNFCSLACSKIMGKKGDGAQQGRSNTALASDAEELDGNSSRCSTPVDDRGTVRSSSSASNSVTDYDAEGAPKKKKKKVEVDPTFDWKTMINNPDFKAASVGLMKHAPLSRMWDNVTIGMKLEVENKDIDPRNHQIAFWVASVVKIQGYMVLLRFEGFANDTSGDFWINLCSHDIHHVGWCANKGKPLIPPRSISRKFTDWRNFLVNRLTGARTLPQNFQQKVQTSLKSKYEVGDQLEVVDKNRICQLRLATVKRIVGRRLHVEYFDSTEDGGFWCHEESRLIHPKGWAKTIGHEIVAPKYYTPNSLLPTPYDAEFEEMDLQVGMKLEAIDPLNLSAICAATIKKVLRRGYVMVRVDCYEEDSTNNGSDWFCYHISSPYVFPCGFCEENGITLTPPYGYDKSNFKWNDYLNETDTRPAPVKQKKAINHKFKVGMKVEAADLMDPRLICVATISHIVGRLLKIHFDGWEEEYDQWLDARSPDIYPVGWCELVNHKLEPPRAPPKPIQPVKKGKKGKKGKTGPGKGKPGGPGRPAKNPSAVGTSSAAKKIAGNQRTVTPADIESPSTTTNTVPVRASQIASGPRRSSLQQQAEQLKSESGRGATRNQTPALVDESTSDESMVTSTTTTIASSVKPETETKTVIETMPTSSSSSSSVTSPVAATMNGSQLKVDATKTEENSTLIRKMSTDTAENNGTSTPSSSTTHIIPRLTDNPSCCENVDPSAWGPEEVVSFLNSNECGAHSELFQKNKITGQTLLTLTKDQIVILTGMKVGPALKIVDLIGQLKRFVTTAKARNALVK